MDSVLILNFWTSFFFHINLHFYILYTHQQCVIFIFKTLWEIIFKQSCLCQNSLFDNSSIFATAVIWHIFYFLVLSWPILDSLALFFLLIQSQYWSTYYLPCFNCTIFKPCMSWRSNNFKKYLTKSFHYSREGGNHSIE